MLEVTNAEYVEGYTIRVCFNTGECGTVDLKDALWGPVFEPLKDIDLFKRFEVSDVLHTVRWENNADLAPEFLRDKMIEQAAARGRAGTRS
ncbi:MAG: DUF2442 domain-containing protein [Candidatus Abyssubacteria bacterium]